VQGRQASLFASASRIDLPDRFDRPPLMSPAFADLKVQHHRVCPDRVAGPQRVGQRGQRLASQVAPSEARC
jgi:hypothetical protein